MAHKINYKKYSKLGTFALPEQLLRAL